MHCATIEPIVQAYRLYEWKGGHPQALKGVGRERSPGKVICFRPCNFKGAVHPGNTVHISCNHHRWTQTPTPVSRVLVAGRQGRERSTMWCDRLATQIKRGTLDLQTCKSDPQVTRCGNDSPHSTLNSPLGSAPSPPLDTTPSRSFVLRSTARLVLLKHAGWTVLNTLQYLQKPRFRQLISLSEALTSRHKTVHTEYRIELHNNSN